MSTESKQQLSGLPNTNTCILRKDIREYPSYSEFFPDLEKEIDETEGIIKINENHLENNKDTIEEDSHLFWDSLSNTVNIESLSDNEIENDKIEF